MSFSNLGLSAPILKALHEQEYETPTAIQLKAIPAILEKKDVMAAAQTGTGKTAGFTLPILELLSQGEKARTRQVRTLILTPTRELAAQVADSVATYGKHIGLRSAAVFGGVNIRPQISALSRGLDILIATPGRLLDLYQQRAMNFDQLEMLVLDEADRMLDMGFVDDIKKIMALLPRKRQNMMFSATFSAGIRELAKKLMCDPVEISVTPANTTVDAVEQIVYTVDKKQKGELLKHLIWDGRWEQVLVFTKTKHGANRLAELLEKSGMESVAIHGNKSQGARTKALRQFKEGKVRALVATDIAARGLDIELLPHVVNFDLPHVAEDYVHRIGRTGRAGATGQAISLVSADEAGQLSDIERLIKKKLPRKTADGFEPKHAVPEVSHGSNSQNRSRGNVRSGGRHRDRNYGDSPRRDDRKDSRGEKRFDSRDRKDSRGEKRFDSRDRKDSRGEKRFDPRDRKDSRGEKRFTPRPRDDRSEDRRDDGREKRFVPRDRADSRGEKRFDPRDRKESSGERRFTPRDRTDSRGEKRFTPRDRTENREDSRGEKRFTPRARTETFAPRGDRKDSRGEKRFDSRDRRSDDRKESTRSDERKPKREFRGGAEKDFRSGPRKPGNFSRSKPRN